MPGHQSRQRRGISAFKFNQRHLDVDESHPRYGVTPRAVLRSLAEAVESLGLAHPLHVHCSNLGAPGNIASTLATIDAVEGRRLHLTHAQFHCYGSDGPHGFSSAADQLADRVNASPQLSIDVGQVLFGQTVTISAIPCINSPIAIWRGHAKRSSKRRSARRDVVFCRFDIENPSMCMVFNGLLVSNYFFDREPLSSLSHHRSSQRSSLHRLSSPDSVVDGL